MADWSQEKRVTRKNKTTRFLKTSEQISSVLESINIEGVSKGEFTIPQ